MAEEYRKLLFNDNNGHRLLELSSVMNQEQTKRSCFGCLPSIVSLFHGLAGATGLTITKSNGLITVFPGSAFLLLFHVIPLSTYLLIPLILQIVYWLTDAD